MANSSVFKEGNIYNIISKNDTETPNEDLAICYAVNEKEDIVWLDILRSNHKNDDHFAISVRGAMQFKLSSIVETCTIVEYQKQVINN